MLDLKLKELERLLSTWIHLRNSTETELGGILYDMVPLIYIKFENMQIKIMYFFMAEYHMKIV